VNIEWTQILIQIINFGLIVFVLSKLMYKPVIKILKQRTERIEASQIEADRLTKESQKSTEKAKTLLLEAQADADKIRSEAKKEALVEANAIISKAKAQAKTAAEAERKSIISALESEHQVFLADMSKLVTETTSQVLQNGLTTEQQHQIISSQLDLIKSADLV
jgi:F-type H+-transporting ATPase subunit b